MATINRKNNRKLDFLIEIGNIGTGNALTALSKFIDKKVDMKEPDVTLLDYDMMLDSVGGSEKVVSGFLLNVTGDLNGLILYLIQEDLASEVCDILLGENLVDLTKMGEMETSLIKEIANIMTGSYVSALAEMTGMKINISVPALAVDMAGAILSVPLIHFESISANVMYMQNKFSIESKDYGSSILFFLEEESIQKLMVKFGVEE